VRKLLVVAVGGDLCSGLECRVSWKLVLVMDCDVLEFVHSENERRFINPDWRLLGIGGNLPMV